MTHHDIKDLGLTDASANMDAGCACSGGSCACGGHGESHNHGHHDHGHGGATEAAQQRLVTTDLAVTGMTCGHCVSSVTEELSAVGGVETVSVQLNAGGVSTVTVASDVAVDMDALRAAVSEAGYSLAES